MKYNPKINDEIAKLPGFSDVHPLQPEHTVQGCLEVYKLAEEYLCEITGMDAMDFQPAAGAHGEFTGLKLIRAYHRDRNDTKRDKIIVPFARIIRPVRLWQALLLSIFLQPKKIRRY